mmetsp:Transcript_14048/g.21881  ORF Transcript_14048/g.21881 Transcript_14048/m.21881 type:complete len:238 (-) Transcript_14048:1784-2497(-)
MRVPPKESASSNIQRNVTLYKDIFLKQKEVSKQRKMQRKIEKQLGKVVDARREILTIPRPASKRVRNHDDSHADTSSIERSPRSSHLPPKKKKKNFFITHLHNPTKVNEVLEKEMEDEFNVDSTVLHAIGSSNACYEYPGGEPPDRYLYIRNFKDITVPTPMYLWMLDKKRKDEEEAERKRLEEIEAKKNRTFSEIAKRELQRLEKAKQNEAEEEGTALDPSGKRLSFSPVVQFQDF